MALRLNGSQGTGREGRVFVRRSRILQAGTAKKQKAFPRGDAEARRKKERSGE